MTRLVSDAMIAAGIVELRAGIDGHATDRQTVANVFVAMSDAEIDTDEEAISELKIDPERRGQRETGIYVRARTSDGQRMGSFDISWLDKASLLSWLRSRGGDNPWAENTVLLLLGHKP